MEKDRTYVLGSMFGVPPNEQQRLAKVVERLAAHGFTLRTYGVSYQMAAVAAATRGGGHVELYVDRPERAQNLDRQILNNVNVHLRAIPEDRSVGDGQTTIAATQMRLCRALLQGSQNDPARFVLIWSADGGERPEEVKGRVDSNATLIRMAAKWGQSLYNLARPESLNRLAAAVQQIAQEQVSKRSTAAIVYVDASVLNNQRADQRRAATAALLVVDDQLRAASARRLDIPVTNQQAEILAAKRGIELAKEHGYDEILLRTDSEYVVKTLAGEFRRKTNLDYWLELENAARGTKIAVEHVRGHCGERFNTLADKLARLTAEGRDEQAATLIARLTENPQRQETPARVR